jgi:hypothetical protein
MKAVGNMAMVNEILDSNSLSWPLAKGTCADGAPAILRDNSGFMVLVKKMNPNVTPSQRTVQHHASAMTTLHSYLQVMFDVVIQAVNFIQSAAQRFSLNTLYHSFKEKYAIVFKKKSSDYGF